MLEAGHQSETVKDDDKEYGLRLNKRWNIQEVVHHFAAGLGKFRLVPSAGIPDDTLYYYSNARHEHYHIKESQC